MTFIRTNRVIIYRDLCFFQQRLVFFQKHQLGIYFEPPTYSRLVHMAGTALLRALASSLIHSCDLHMKTHGVTSGYATEHFGLGVVEYVSEWFFPLFINHVDMNSNPHKLSFSWTQEFVRNEADTEFRDDPTMLNK